MQRGAQQPDGPDSTVIVQLEEAVARFEAAWSAGSRPAIEDYLPPDASLRQEVLAELVHADLEFRIKAGDKVTVEAYLDRFPELRQQPDAFVEFVLREYKLRVRGPKPPAIDEYLLRFPALRDELLAKLPQVTPAARRAVHFNCPHCRNPIELTDDGEDELVCPACGSTFRLDSTRTNTWSAQRLPCLGRFQLLEAVGRGSFGTVYRARDTQLDRLVAIKVPRSGRLFSAEEEERFVREARNAAQLQHPGIVPVYEVGRGEAFPYIVSEFVEGVTLGDFLTSRRLSFRETAETVRHAAVALEHAHSQGVVHRDLKPANLMLQHATDADSGRRGPAESQSGISSSTRLAQAISASTMIPWRVRIMDFGLARRDDGGLTVTMEGQVLGTPAYMSPEQARGDNKDVSRASDVYSLGVILYELLTGELPFRGNQRMLLHQVLYDDPRPPRQLNDRIPRDLETIALRAMAKEPSRRYASAAELADDLGRWLAGEPILSRPISALERGFRWCRRNPAPSLAATSIVAAVAAVLVTLSVAVVRIKASADAERLARQEAQRQAQENEQIAAEQRQQRELAVRLQQEAEGQRKAAQESEGRALAATNFLVSVFDAADPLGLRSFGLGETVDRDRPFSGREMLDRGRQRMERELADQPLVQATLSDALGMAYLGLGDFEAAQPLLQRGLDIRTAHLPREHPDVLASLKSRALLKFLRSEITEAESLLREVLAAQQKSSDCPPLSLASTQFYLAVMLNELYRPAEAEPLFRAALEVRQRELGPQHQETLLTRISLAATLVGENKPPELRLEEALQWIQGAPPELGVALTGLLIKYWNVNKLRQGKEYEAATVASRALREEAAHVLGSGHPVVVALEFDFAGMLIHQGKLAEAESVARKALSQVPRVIASNPRLAEPHFRVAQVMAARGENAAAEEHLRTAMRVAGLIQVKEHLWGVSASLELARCKQHWGELTESEQICRDVLARLAEAQAAAPVQQSAHQARQIEAQLTLIGILLDQGRPDEAALLAKQLLDQTWSTREAQPFDASYRARVYAITLREQGEHAAARQVEADALDIILRSVPQAGITFGIPEASNWASYLQERGELAVAEKLFRFALDAARKSYRPDQVELSGTLNLVGGFLRDHGDAAEAARLLEEAFGIRRDVWGLPHQDTLTTQIALALCHHKLGNSTEALRWGREAYENALQMYGDESVQNYEAARTLARLLAEDDNASEAEQLLRRTLKLHAEKLPPAHPQLWKCYADLADVLIELKEWDEARIVLKRGLTNFVPVFPANSWRLAELRSRLGYCESQSDDRQPGEANLLESLAILETAFGPRHERFRSAIERVAQHYETAGNRSAADRYRARLAGQ